MTRVFFRLCVGLACVVVLPALGAAGVPGDENWDARFGALGMSSPVRALATDGVNLYVGGDFTTAGGAAANRIARWNGTSWSALGSGVSGTVNAIAVSGTDVYVGGSFSTAGGIGALNIARWDGSSWSALGLGTSGVINTIAIDGPNVYVGGLFSTAGGVGAKNIARWNGAAWSALGLGASSTVNAIAVGGTDIYVGGAFTAAGGIGALHVARWNGAAWSALGLGTSNPVNAIAIDGTNVYAGGDFTTAGGIAAFRIARWNGAAWSALGGGLNSSVNAISIAGANLYAGGAFTTAAGANANRIARWDGSSWFNLGNGTNTDVLAVLASATEVYVGGQFTTAGGKSSLYFGRWDASTTPVFVLNFTASPTPSGVMISWEIAADEIVLGYRLHRRRANDTRYTIVNPGLLAPNVRTFRDEGVEPDTRYRYVLGAMLSDGSETKSREIEVSTPAVALSLGQNYPNPFNPTTTIPFVLPRRAHVRLTVFDAEGKRVVTLLDRTLDAGKRQVRWDGRDAERHAVSTGVYFYRLSTGRNIHIRKMILIK